MLLIAHLGVLVAIALGHPALALPPTTNDGIKPLATNTPIECNTAACAAAANDIREFLDPTADPCEDFYDYACGRFLKEIELPNTNESMEVQPSFYDVKNKVHAEVVSLIREPIDAAKDSKPIAMAKQYFADCVDNEAHGKSGLQPLVERLEQMGCLSTEKQRPIGKWWELAEKFVAAGFNGDFLMVVEVARDLLNTHQHVIYLVPPFATFDHQTIFDVEQSDGEQYGATIGLDVNDLERVAEFIVKLKSIDMEIKLQDVHNNYVQLAVLQTRHPYVNWTNYINSQLPHEARVNSSELVVVASLDYLDHLGKVLSQTPDQVVANFMVLNVVARLISLKPNTTSDTAMDEKKCLQLTKQRIPGVVDAMYVRRYADVATRDAVTEMVNRVRVVLTENLYSNIDWVDPETKRGAVQKMNAIRQMIAFPDELLDDALLEELYAGVNVQNLSFDAASKRLEAWNFSNYLAKCGQPVDRALNWLHLNIAEVNAFYFRKQNMIVLPAAILQGRFFGINRPNYVNFASIGTVIGHEFTHAFDSKNRRYDENGDFSHWWTTESNRRYEERAACLLDQYSHFIEPITQKPLNANYTQGDDIADNGSIHLVYKTYQQWVDQQHHSEPPLPGLDLTPNQLFWLSYGQAWCSKSNYASAIGLLNRDRHSPNRFRVLGPLMNSQAFAKDFACPLGSPMNPANKCRFVKDYISRRYRHLSVTHDRYANQE